MGKRNIIIAVVFVVLLVGVAAFMFWPRPAQTPVPPNNANTSNESVSRLENTEANQSNTSNDTVVQGSTLNQTPSTSTSTTTVNEEDPYVIKDDRTYTPPGIPMSGEEPIPGTEEYVSTPVASLVPMNRVQEGVEHFLNAYYTYNWENVNGVHETVVRATLGQQGLDKPDLILLPTDQSPLSHGGAPRATFPFPRPRFQPTNTGSHTHIILQLELPYI